MSFRFASVFLAMVVHQTAWGSSPGWLINCMAADVSEWSAGGATVRLLDYQETKIISDRHQKTKIRRADRITSSAGLADAVVEYYYYTNAQKVVSAHAWIVSPDGKRTKSYTENDFRDVVAEVSSYMWDSLRVVRFNASRQTEIGGVLAWEFEVETDSGRPEGDCSFFSSIPVVRAIYEIVPPPGGKLIWCSSSPLVPPPTPGREPGALRWEMQRFTPPPQGRVPDGFIPNPLRVSVYCQTAATAGGNAPGWDDLGRLLSPVIEPQIRTTPELKAKAELIVAGKTKRWDRIRALTEFLQREVTYLSVENGQGCLTGYRPHRADDVLKNRYGDCKDKATLLSAMLRAIGDHGDMVLLYATNPRMINDQWPELIFNHAIVGIPADEDVPPWWPVVALPGRGRTVLFDATNSVTPLGALPIMDQGGCGLLLSEGKLSLFHLPGDDSAYSGFERHVEAKLEETGRMKAEVREVWQGAQASEQYELRTYLRSEKFGQTLEGRVHGAISFPRDLQWTDAWGPEAARWKLNYSFMADKITRRATAETVLLNPSLLGGPERLSPWSEPKLNGECWLPAANVHEEVKLDLPPGLQASELPENWKLEVSSASAALAYRVEGNAVVYECKIVRPAGFYDKPAYDALAVFYQKLEKARRRPVILHVPSIPAKT